MKDHENSDFEVIFLGVPLMSHYHFEKRCDIKGAGATLRVQVRTKGTVN